MVASMDARVRVLGLCVRMTALIAEADNDSEKLEEVVRQATNLKQDLRCIERQSSDVVKFATTLEEKLGGVVRVQYFKEAMVS